MYHACIAWIKTESNTQQWKERRKKGWKISATRALRAKARCCVPGSRTEFQKFTLRQSQFCVSLSIMYLSCNLIMSFRRLNLLKIMSPIHMSTTHSYIPKHAGNKSGFCSTVTAQIKPQEEIVGPSVTTRPRLKAKSGRSCTTFWWKRQLFVLGSFVLTNSTVWSSPQTSLEFI